MKLWDSPGPLRTARSAGRLLGMDTDSNHRRVGATTGPNRDAIDLNLDTPKFGATLHRCAVRSGPTAAAGSSTTHYP